MLRLLSYRLVAYQICRQWVYYPLLVNGGSRKQERDIKPPSD